jgi:hypothetical protein
MLQRTLDEFDVRSSSTLELCTAHSHKYKLYCVLQLYVGVPLGRSKEAGRQWRIGN